MIIRLTLSENDFITHLEDFVKGLRNRMFVFDEPCPQQCNYKSVKEYGNALFTFWDKEKAADKKRSYLMDPNNRFSQTSSEYKEICNEVIRQWIIFAPSCGLERWTPNVSIQYKVSEKWQNDEVVYYFTARDKFITQ